MEEEYKVNEDLLQSLNNEGACKTIAMKKYAMENHIPVLRQNTASLLISLLRMKQPKRILEIGTAIGYSGTIILENTSEETVLHTLENDENNIKIAKENFNKLGFNNRVTIFEGDAKSILPSLKKSYDFIFLDGPKGQYIHYLPYLITLLNKGGVLFADNVLHRGRVFSGKTIPHKNRSLIKNLEKFLIAVSESSELKTQIINLEDGISISIKE